MSVYDKCDCGPRRERGWCGRALSPRGEVEIWAQRLLHRHVSGAHPHDPSL